MRINNGCGELPQLQVELSGDHPNADDRRDGSDDLICDRKTGSFLGRVFPHRFPGWEERRP
jgi:hypothetical protein